MYLTPKKSFKWTASCCCCGSVTPALLSLLAEICNHIVLLSLASVLLNNTEAALQTLADSVDTKDRLLQRSQFYQIIQENILASPTLYTSIPIILNVVFLMSNIFSLVGVLISNHLLLLPWLLLYCIKILFISSVLVYLVILLPLAWFKVLLCLVIIPVIVIETSFWLIIFKLTRRLRGGVRKIKTAGGVKLNNISQPVRAVSGDDISTTLPMEDLAVAPPHITWNPDYLLELDPRYLNTQEGEPEEEEEEEGDVRESEVEWESEESYYQSDDYTVREAGEETEIFTETDGELLEDQREEETDFPDDESEHYKTPRPVMRSAQL